MNLERENTTAITIMPISQGDLEPPKKPDMDADKLLVDSDFSAGSKSWEESFTNSCGVGSISLESLLLAIANPPSCSFLTGLKDGVAEDFIKDVGLAFGWGDGDGLAVG